MYTLINHKQLNKLMPIILAIICMVLYAISIMGFESHKKQGDDVYVSLLPADPRSLLQGDYMALRYELHINNPNIKSEHNHSNENSDETFDNNNYEWEYNNPHIQDRHKLTLWIKKDDKNILTQSYFDKQQNTTPLIVKNPNNWLDTLYPASNSFFFAEGLGECYENAKFAHLKVDTTGKPLLVGLLGDELKPLNCETKSISYSSW